VNEEYFPVVVSVFIFALWILAYVSCWVCQWVWAWIDDSEVSDRSKMIDLLMRLYGYKVRESYYHSDGAYIKKLKVCSTYACGASHSFLSLGALCALPWVIYASVLFYDVAICLVIIVMVIFLSRYARRHKKLFDKHIANKDAHK